MRRIVRAGCAAATVIALWTGPAAAVHTERIPYVGIAADQMLTDSARDADDGLGVQLTLGVPTASGSGAVELRYTDVGYDSAGNSGDSQSALFVDYVRDFGVIGRGGDGFLRGIKPFVSAGLGFIHEDVTGDKHLHFGASLGGGVLLPLGFHGWAARLDARVVPQANNESVPAENSLIDYHVTLGLQVPMTLFFDKPVTLAPAEDCPVEVVGENGRADCRADSDGDGVEDRADACPGTPEGTAVDRRGCTKVSNDTDGDGVLNAQDRCPGTQADLKVDATGCVVAQNTALRGVTFDPNSAHLTAEGRAVLDSVTSTLKGQEALKVEIAGHTDSIGSEAYNMLLSQQRAEAVRAYLVEKGVADERMSAVGYGELEPVETNESDEGRMANRRVEFRISTD